MQKEHRIALKNVGKINPENIQDYISNGGFKGIRKALDLSHEYIIEQLKKSGLKGRGGAGFPTGQKVNFVNDALCDYFGSKYVVCNADEGEPGTFKDRIIMEEDPLLLLEGMVISAFAIGASKGYIYIRAEYYKSIKMVANAIRNAYSNGYLGKNILGSSFSFDLEIKLGAGSYLCGEELTLLESLEGKRGYPRIKPPFPAQKGLWGKPTLVNNVETFANVPYIVENGASQYRLLGLDQSTGTKIFTVSGDVKKPGYFETEMGISLREIINDFCGGMKNKVPFQAALIGGAAGTFVNEDMLDVPLAYHTLKEKGAVLGSGAIMIMNKDRSLLDMTRSIMQFFKHESCGKCVPCRVGTTQLVKLIESINEKNAEKILVKMLEEAKYMAGTSLCPLGQSPVLPLQSIFDFFNGQVS